MSYGAKIDSSSHDKDPNELYYPPDYELDTMRKALALLNLDLTCTKDQFLSAYRRASILHHPGDFSSVQLIIPPNFGIHDEAYIILWEDRGGSLQNMQLLNGGKDLLLRYWKYLHQLLPEARFKAQDDGGDVKTNSDQQHQHSDNSTEESQSKQHHDSDISDEESQTNQEQHFNISDRESHSDRHQNSDTTDEDVSGDDEHPLRCTLCNKNMKSKNSYKIHMRDHRNYQRFRCNECNKSFPRKNNLERHMRQHTGQKPFPCGTCGKRFCQRSDLRRHMITHTNTRPYKCSKCTSRFNTRSNLKRHRVKSCR
ncbi:Protein glass [Frankliniella fusca]|uniref:Protein glass n=1 Tax=Frankliniella fusca TaxID=407009 RepID=A0AAE1L9Z1_9NEOP|nr:Protein glass [Frankliniella fusca]